MEQAQSWKQRISEVVRERPASCPDCGSERVVFEFRFKPSSEQQLAIEPYKDFIRFAYNRGCCLPNPNGPLVLEAWTCRQCGENWAEVFYHKQNSSTLDRTVREKTDGRVGVRKVLLKRQREKDDADAEKMKGGSCD